MLKTLDITNFTCFPKAKLEFSPGLNVIVGENGTGKSHLLKLGYAISKAYALESAEVDFEKLKSFTLESLNRIFKTHSTFQRDNTKQAIIKYSFVNEEGGLCIFETGRMACSVKNKQGKVVNSANPLFIPTKEVLSIFKGFAASLRKRELGFDGTYLDISDALALTHLINVEHDTIKKYYAPIEDAFQRHVILDDDGDFSFIPYGYEASREHEKVASSIKAQMSAEGHNKLGMLAWLIKNGSLSEGSSLFWDEPEANLNPKLLKSLASILVELSSIIQITIATHSLFLLRELDICLRQTKYLPHKAIFAGLHMQDDGSVTCIQSKSISDIGDITALDASLEQTDRFMAVRNV